MLEWISLGLLVAMGKTERQIERVGNLVNRENKFQI
jgi:hypothetical protein